MPNEATTCLDTREAQDRFRERYAEYVRAEAGKLTRDPARIQELTNGVFDRMNKRYAVRALPADCCFALMAQLNLQYAGDALPVEGYTHPEERPAAVHYTPNAAPSRRAERYAQSRAEPSAPAAEPAADAPRARKRRRAMTAAVVAAAAGAAPAAVEAPVVPMPAPSVADEKPPAAPAPSAAEEAPAVPSAPAASSTSAAPSAADAAPSVSPAAQNANYDPNSTILWTADAPFSPIAEVEKAQDEARFEQPEEDPNARSVPLTIINTLLFILCIAAAIFLVLQMNIIPGFSLS